MDTHPVLNLVFPISCAGVNKMWRKVRHSPNWKVLNAEINVSNFDQAQNPRPHRVRNILEMVLKRNPNIEKVHVKAERGTGVEAVDARTLIQKVLEPLGPNRLVTLHLQGVVLLGDWDCFCSNLRHQSALTTLHLENFSPMPEREGKRLPALFRAVSEIPKLKEFHFKAVLTVYVSGLLLEPFVSALIALATVPNLEVLNLRDLAVGGDGCCRALICLVEALHSHRSLQELTLGNHQATHAEECKLFEAIATMLSSSSLPPLKSLALHTAPPTDLIEAAEPILNAVTSCRTLQHLSFVRSPFSPLGAIVIPDEFALFLEKDNLKLERLDIYTSHYVGSKYVRTRVALPHRTEFYLKLNRGGRRLLLEEQFERESSWMKMLWESRQDVDVLYYYLKCNPDLVNRMRLLDESKCLDPPPAKRCKTARENK